MISIQTPAGPKALFLRGIQTPAGKKSIAKASVLTPGGDKIVWDSATALTALTVIAQPPYVSGAAATSTPIDITTNATEVQASGGTAPYTYSWAGSEPGWTITSPAGRSTSFTHTADGGGAGTAGFTCTVTDARGATGTVDVTAHAINYGGL